LAEERGDLVGLLDMEVWLVALVVEKDDSRAESQRDTGDRFGFLEQHEPLRLKGALKIVGGASVGTAPYVV
jgi:hypothetical protein